MTGITVSNRRSAPVCSFRYSESFWWAPVGSIAVACVGSRGCGARHAVAGSSTARMVKTVISGDMSHLELLWRQINCQYPPLIIGVDATLSKLLLPAWRLASGRPTDQKDL